MRRRGRPDLLLTRLCLYKGVLKGIPLRYPFQPLYPVSLLASPGVSLSTSPPVSLLAPGGIPFSPRYPGQNGVAGNLTLLGFLFGEPTARVSGRLGPHGGFVVRHHPTE